MKYNVEVSKDHSNNETVYGFIIVEAGRKREAVKRVGVMIYDGMKTLDPRIKWDKDCTEIEGDYIDFTFEETGFATLV